MIQGLTRHMVGRTKANNTLLADIFSPLWASKALRDRPSQMSALRSIAHFYASPGKLSVSSPSLDHIAGREIPRVNRRLRREGRALGASTPIFTHQITHCVKMENAPEVFACGAFTHSPAEVHRIHYILRQRPFCV